MTCGPGYPGPSGVGCPASPAPELRTEIKQNSVIVQNKVQKETGFIFLELPKLSEFNFTSNIQHSELELLKGQKHCCTGCMHLS